MSKINDSEAKKIVFYPPDNTLKKVVNKGEKSHKKHKLRDGVKISSEARKEKSPHGMERLGSVMRTIDRQINAEKRSQAEETPSPVLNRGEIKRILSETGEKTSPQSSEQQKNALGGAIYAQAEKNLSKANPHMTSKQKADYFTAAANLVEKDDRIGMMNLDAAIAEAGGAKFPLGIFQEPTGPVMIQIVTEIQQLNPRIKAGEMKEMLLNMAKIAAQPYNQQGN